MMISEQEMEAWALNTHIKQYKRRGVDYQYWTTTDC